MQSNSNRLKLSLLYFLSVIQYPTRLLEEWYNFSISVLFLRQDINIYELLKCKINQYSIYVCHTAA